jgi:3-dehydroquinate synthetase
VTRDELEGGLRRHLNLGHTFAHGIEAASGFSRYLHGEAVAMGLIAACRLGVSRSGLDPDLVERTRDLVRAFQLPVRAGLPLDEVRPHMATDKKKQGKRLVFVVPERLGHVTVCDDALEDEVREALAEIV